MGVRAPPGTPSPGARVFLTGLRNPELNGCHGEVLRWVGNSGRLEVRIDKDGTTKAVRGENVQLLEKPVCHDLVRHACGCIRIHTMQFCAATTCSRWSWQARHRRRRGHSLPME